MSAATAGAADPDQDAPKRNALTLDEALERYASRSPLLLASDFDGVLAPFEDDPEAVQPLPDAIADLRRLAAIDGVHVAVVSGRDLATLSRLTGIGADEPIALIGSHGAESTSEAVREAMAAAVVSPEDEQRLRELTADITELIEREHPTARLEHKAAAVVVHTRGLPRDESDAAIAAAREHALALDGVRVLKGKGVVELSVSHADKGTALTAYGRWVGAQGRLYLGDDVTDEDVFVRMRREGDVTIKVGTGSTAARHRVDDERAAAEVLRRLAETLAPRG